MAEAGKLREVTPGELRTRLAVFSEALASRGHVERSGWVRSASLKLLSVVLAVTAWAVVARSQTEVVERTLVLPVVYRNVPQRWIIDEPEPAEVKATVSGAAAAFGGLDPERLVATLDVSQVQEGKQNLAIAPASLGLPGELTLQRLHPSSVEVVARQLVETQVRVTADTTGRLPRGLVLQALKVDPKEVSILVLATDRPRHRSLKTAPLDLATIEETTTVEKRVLLPEGVQSPEGGPLTVHVTAVVRQPAARTQAAASGSGSTR